MKCSEVTGIMHNLIPRACRRCAIGPSRARRKQINRKQNPNSKSRAQELGRMICIDTRAT